MVLGAMLVVIWTPLPALIPYALILMGSIFGVTLIMNERALKEQ